MRLQRIPNATLELTVNFLYLFILDLKMLIFFQLPWHFM